MSPIGSGPYDLDRTGFHSHPRRSRRALSGLRPDFSRSSLNWLPTSFSVAIKSGAWDVWANEDAKNMTNRTTWTPRFTRIVYAHWGITICQAFALRIRIVRRFFRQLLARAVEPVAGSEERSSGSEGKGWSGRLSESQGV